MDGVKDVEFSAKSEDDLEWENSNEAATVGDDAKFLAELQKRVQVEPVLLQW